MDNKETLSRPNGVVLTYGYDALNRLRSVVNRRGVGETAPLVSSF